MDSPRLNGYPYDQEVVRRIRARQRARESERRARRSTVAGGRGLARLWSWLLD